MHFCDCLCDVCANSDFLCEAKVLSRLLHHEMMQITMFSFFEHEDWDDSSFAGGVRRFS